MEIDDDPVSTPRKSRPWTFRVENIPANTSPEQLLEQFAEQDRPFIEVRSLAPAVVSNDGELTATISFTTKDGPSRRDPLLLDPDSSMISVDEDFFGLTPLNAPQDPIIADIIAVTGLGGHAIGSWSYSHRYMWLRDFLPKDLPHVRVLTYGYNSQLRRASSRNILGDHVRMFKQRLITLPRSATSPHRPIVFIGHSLGCLIIKKSSMKALVELKSSQAGSHVWQTPFVVFLGAPHRGLDNKALQTLVMPEFSKDIVDELGEHSSTLTDLNENFAKIAHDLQILSCYELRPTPTVVLSSDGTWKRDGPSAMMVSQNSAMLHSAHELRAPCDADHTHIAKLKRTEASLYHIIKGHIQQALEKFQAPEHILQQHVSQRREIEFLESRAQGQTLGNQSSQQAMQDALPSGGLELGGLESGRQRPILPSPLELPTTSLTKESRKPGAPTAQEQQVHERDASARRKEVPSPKDQSALAELESQQPLFLSGEPVQHSPVDASARASLAETLSEAPTEPRTTTPNAGTLTSHSYNDRPAKISSQYEEEFLDDVWDAQSDGSKYVVVPTRSRGPSPKQPEYPSPEPAPPDVKTKDESMTPTPPRRMSKDVFSVFKRKNSKPDLSEFLAAARDNNVSRMKELLAAGADLESKTSQNDNRTALHEAASLEHTEVAQFLISAGAKKDAKTKSKSTPLHEAAWAGSTEVARMLIRAGAQKEARNLDDSTPLQLAAIRGHRDVAQILVDHGANVHTTRTAGITPLDDAKTNGHKEVAQVLVRAGAAMRSRWSRREDEQETQWPGLF